VDNATDKLLSDFLAEMTVADIRDDGFVGRVASRIAKRRRLLRVVRACAVVIFLGVAMILSPSLVAAGIYIARVPVVLTESWRMLLMSPSGWVAVVLIAVFFLARVVVWTFDTAS
jgi:hypothetical protein